MGVALVPMVFGVVPLLWLLLLLPLSILVAFLGLVSGLPRALVNAGRVA